MAGPAATGVTMVFTLNASTPTQIAPANSGRRWLLITNSDPSNTIAVGFGTNNGATTVMHQIPAQCAMELLAPPYGDVSAIALAGTPQCAYTES